MAKSRNFSGSTELLKAHTKHFPSRRASRIQRRGAASALCSTEKHIYLGAEERLMVVGSQRAAGIQLKQEGYRRDAQMNFPGGVGNIVVIQ